MAEPEGRRSLIIAVEDSEFSAKALLWFLENVHRLDDEVREERPCEAEGVRHVRLSRRWGRGGGETWWVLPRLVGQGRAEMGAGDGCAVLLLLQ